jgi:hypothetical protein
MVCCVGTIGGVSDLPYKKKFSNPCYSKARWPWFLGWTVRVPYQAGDRTFYSSPTLTKCRRAPHRVHSGPLLENYLIPWSKRRHWVTKFLTKIVYLSVMTIKLTLDKIQGSRIRRPVLAHFLRARAQIVYKFWRNSIAYGNFEELNKSWGFP